MSYILLKFKKNWADEFDCEGFKIMNLAEHDYLDNLFATDFGDESVNWNFGSNEGWEDEFTFRTMWNSYLTKTIISKEEADIIQKHLLSVVKMSGTYYESEYGIFPVFSDLFEYFYDDDRVDEYYDLLNSGEFDL